MKNTLLTRTAVVWTVCAGAATLVYAQTAPMSPRWHSTPILAADPLPRSLAPRLNRPAPSYQLAKLDKSEADRPAVNGRPRVGLVRTVPAAAAQAGRWEIAADGRPTWRLTLVSPSAQGTRLHLRRNSTTPGRLWAGPADLPEQAELYEGEAASFWTMTVPGEAITISYQPESAVPEDSEPPITLLSAVHLWRDVGHEAQAAATCYLDVACYPDWNPSINAVAVYDFISGGDAYACSGTMIETRQHSNQPYFLTANHCVSTPDEAATVETYWNYQTPVCGGVPPTGPSAAARVRGASFVAGGGPGSGDFSLLRLSSLPPVPFVFAGWSLQPPSVGSRLALIAHPESLQKRIAFGVRVQDGRIVDGDTGEILPADRYYQLSLTEGRSNPGASGGGVFSSPGVLVGVHSHGESVADNPQRVCDLSSQASGEGRFTSMYETLRPYLEDQPLTPTTFSAIPASLTFSAAQGAIAPSPQTITIRGPVEPSGITASTSATWLSATVSAGSVTVRVELSNLAAGSYQGTVTVTGGNIANGPLRVPVSLQVTAPLLAASPPLLAGNGVLNGASFRSGISPGSWIAIFGQNFVDASRPGRIWRNEEIVNGSLPTSLDGVSVRVDGRPAAVYYVSPGQLNVQVPDTNTVGSVIVEVSNSQGRALTTATLDRVAPGLFTANGRAAAVFPDGVPVGVRPAKPGDIVLLFGTGFGATSPERPSGKVISVAPLTTAVTATIGNVPAQVQFSGLVSAGLYQFNVVVPENAPSGNLPVVLQVGGLATQPGVLMPVQR